MRPVDLLVILSCVCAAGACQADALVEMNGAWSGSGWAREAPEGPKEVVRCRLDNSYDATKLELTIKGRCVVPGRRIAIAGRLQGTAEADQITGRWFNPDGIGSVRVSGIQRDKIVTFAVRATDPLTNKEVAQTIELRLADGTLRLRAADQSDLSVLMSDVTFAR